MAGHATFKEIKVHTAKCDTCNQHNTHILYRCVTCTEQTCTPCLKRGYSDSVHDYSSIDLTDTPTIPATSATASARRRSSRVPAAHPRSSTTATASVSSARQQRRTHADARPPVLAARLLSPYPYGPTAPPGYVHPMSRPISTRSLPTDISLSAPAPAPKPAPVPALPPTRRIRIADLLNPIEPTPAETRSRAGDCIVIADSDDERSPAPAKRLKAEDPEDGSTRSIVAKRDSAKARSTQNLGLRRRKTEAASPPNPNVATVVLGRLSAKRGLDGEGVSLLVEAALGGASQDAKQEQSLSLSQARSYPDSPPPTSPAERTARAPKGVEDELENGLEESEVVGGHVRFVEAKEGCLTYG